MSGNSLKWEIYFIKNDIIIFRYFNEKTEKFKIRNKDNIEKIISKTDVLQIVYPWRFQQKTI